MKGTVSIGDPVEVRVIVRPRSTPLLRGPASLEPVPLTEEWIPATVVAVSPRNGSISVAFSDGERMAVRRDQWRKAHA